jgi:hypothetical protein
MYVMYVKTLSLLITIIFPIFPSSAVGSDFAPIHGFWSVVGKKFGTTDDTLDIRPDHISRYEERCSPLSTKRNGNRFTLRQMCAVEGEEMTRTVTFRLVRKDRLEANGQIYKRCPRPAGW